MTRFGEDPDHGRGLRVFPDDRYGRVVVVVARPADQPRVSGVIQWWRERGSEVELVVATDGPARDRQRLREALCRQGLAELPVRWLGLPRATLAERGPALVTMLAESMAGADACVVPRPDEPDADRAALGSAGLAAAPTTTHRWSCPIATASTEPGTHTFAYPLTDRQRHRKSAGITAFATPGAPGPRHAMPADAETGVEILCRQPPTRSAPVDRFAELYAADTDPWHTATSWYERRKRAVALAALPRERYRRAVEPACGVGVFTRELAGRCDRVLAFDPVPAAVRRAAAATAELSHVDVRQAALPDGFPVEPVDLVVFGEILYYLDDTDLDAAVARAVAASRPGGHLLAVHWLPWAAEAPRDGTAAHRVLLSHPDLAPIVEHVDERFVLHVLERR